MGSKAVLGCSNYTYAEAAWTQALPDWLGTHVRALEFIGGAPGAIVPDNLKSGVKRAHRYEPEINPSYQDFAEHYVWVPHTSFHFRLPAWITSS
jgi:transposase